MKREKEKKHVQHMPSWSGWLLLGFLGCHRIILAICAFPGTSGEGTAAENCPMHKLAALMCPVPRCGPVTPLKLVQHHSAGLSGVPAPFDQKEVNRKIKVLHTSITLIGSLLVNCPSSSACLSAHPLGRALGSASFSRCYNSRTESSKPAVAH